MFSWQLWIVLALSPQIVVASTSRRDALYDLQGAFVASAMFIKNAKLVVSRSDIGTTLPLSEFLLLTMCGARGGRAACPLSPHLFSTQWVFLRMT